MGISNETRTLLAEVRFFEKPAEGDSVGARLRLEEMRTQGTWADMLWSDSLDYALIPRDTCVEVDAPTATDTSLALIDLTRTDMDLVSPTQTVILQPGWLGGLYREGGADGAFSPGAVYHLSSPGSDVVSPFDVELQAPAALDLISPERPTCVSYYYDDCDNFDPNRLDLAPGEDLTLEWIPSAGKQEDVFVFLDQVLPAVCRFTDDGTATLPSEILGMGAVDPYHVATVHILRMTTSTFHLCDLESPIGVFFESVPIWGPMDLYR